MKKFDSTKSSSFISIQNSMTEQKKNKNYQKVLALETNQCVFKVCREFMRGACKRAESECRFAHPKECVTTDDGLVTVCMDAVKGRCTRAPCRYFHPPLHLQAQIKAAQSRANNIAVMANLQKPTKN